MTRTAKVMFKVSVIRYAGGVSQNLSLMWHWEEGPLHCPSLFPSLKMVLWADVIPASAVVQLCIRKIYLLHYYMGGNLRWAAAIVTHQKEEMDRKDY